MSGQDDKRNKPDADDPYAQTLTAQLEQLCKSRDEQMRTKLKEIEREYRQFIIASIDTCNSLEKMAVRDGRILDAKSWALKAQIYQQILDNYTLSKSYDQQ